MQPRSFKSRSTELRKGLLAAFFANAACGMALAGAPADFRIGPGDTVEIAVSGIPEMRQRTTVQPDGTIAVPLVDAVQVAGLTTAEFRERVRAQLKGKIYRHRDSSGQDVFVVIRSEEVTASVLDFRPIYVAGTVRKPGEVPFRAGMSAQQAIALAGGYGAPGGEAATAQFDLPMLKAQFTATWIDYTKALLRLARVRSELNDADTLDVGETSSIPLPAKDVKGFATLEGKVLAARLLDYRKQRQSFQSASQVLNEQTTVLTKQQKQEEEGANTDGEDLKRLLELLARGQVTSTRVGDARRALLLSSTRALQVSEQLLNIKKQAQENARQLDHFENDRRIALLQESQQATLDMNTALSAQKGIEDKMRVIQGGASNDGNERTEIRVTRKNRDNRVDTVSADPTFTLQPGDVIDVLVRPRDPAPSPGE